MKKGKGGKHPGGRPTLYKGQATCAQVSAFAKGMTAQNFNQRCSIPHVALLLDVNQDTVHAWRKEHVEFSDAIKMWQTKRDAVAFELRGWSDARWIFCMKNWTDMKDKQEVSGPNGGPVAVAFIMPRPEVKK